MNNEENNLNNQNTTLDQTNTAEPIVSNPEVAFGSTNNESVASQVNEVSPQNNVGVVETPSVVSPVVEETQPVESHPVAPVAPVAPVEMSTPVAPTTPVAPVTPTAEQPQVNMVNEPVNNDQVMQAGVVATTSVSDTNQQNNMSVSDLMAPPVGEANNSNQDINYNQYLEAKNNVVNNDSLVRAFVGEKYDSFVNDKFNVGAFFFTLLYMLYRKMYVYALIYFVCLSAFESIAVKFFYSTIILNILCGLFMNKVYLYFANKKVESIKQANAGKSEEELKAICIKKGGTSVGAAIFGGCLSAVLLLLILFIVLGTVFLGMLGIASKGPGNSGVNDTSGAVIEDASINGHTCFNSKCTIYIESKEYSLNTDNNSFVISVLKDYDDYVRIDLYYNTAKSDTIVGYKIYDKDTGKEITNVNNEADLREELGLTTIDRYGYEEA